MTGKACNISQHELTRLPGLLQSPEQSDRRCKSIKRTAKSLQVHSFFVEFQAPIFPRSFLAMTEFAGSLSKSRRVRIVGTHEFRIGYLHLWSDHGLICERRLICHKSHACKSLQKTVSSVQHLQILLCVCPCLSIRRGFPVNWIEFCWLVVLGQSFGPVTTHCCLDSKLKPNKLLRCIETTTCHGGSNTTDMQTCWKKVLKKHKRHNISAKTYIDTTMNTTC